MNNKSEDKIRTKLFELRDTGYRDFQVRLIPGTDPGTVIGVRTPDIRRLAKELAGTPQAAAFMAQLPHSYYDENNLHGCLIEHIKDFSQCAAATEKFLPYIDNWATCDIMNPKAFKRDLPSLLVLIRRWIASGHTYTVRFGLGMLMRHFLGDSFEPEYLGLAAGVRSDEYYVNMMVAWYFATALAKQPQAALPYIEQRRLGLWIHNKTIQKAIESRRITPEQKSYLRSLKIRTPSE